MSTLLEIEAIEKRLSELEAQRNANYWRCHIQGSMSRYRPLPKSFYEERAKLEKRLKELQRVELSRSDARR